MAVNDEVVLSGYHGTHVQYVDEIIDSGFKPKIRDDHWLGQGIYFYPSQDLAKWWIETKLRGLTRKAAVIRATICAKDSQILDLDTVSGMVFFLRETKLILSKSKIKVRMRSTNTVKNLCFCLDLLKINHKLGVITYTFLKDAPSYAEESLWDFEKNFFPLGKDFTFKELQICVTDNGFVKDKVCCHRGSQTNWS